MKSYTLTTAPAIEPVTRADVLSYMRVESSAEDALIDLLIPAARDYVEQSTGRALITQTWTMTSPTFNERQASFPATVQAFGITGPSYYYATLAGVNPIFGSEWNAVTLDRTPLASVASVLYYPADGGAQATMSSSLYQVVTGGEPGRILPTLGNAWPSLADRPDAVQIQFTAGYGATAASVPALLRLAICSLTAWFYEQRQPVNLGNIVNQLPHALDAILLKYRVRGMIG